MHRALCALMLLVLCPALSAAQLPALDPDTYDWLMEKFPIRAGDNTSIYSVTPTGAMLLNGEAVRLPSGALLPIACPNQSFFSMETLNAQGWLAGNCVSNPDSPGNSHVGAILPMPGMAASPIIYNIAGASQSTLTDINDRGYVIGFTFYQDETPFWAGGVGPGSSDGGPVLLLTVVIPGQHISSPRLYGLNNLGCAVGSYEADEEVHGEHFSRDHGLFWCFGQFWAFDVPGASLTTLFDLNDHFFMVGWAAVVSAFLPVLYDPRDGSWSEIRPPYPWQYIDVVSITNAGQFTGRIGMDDPNRPGFLLWHGFVATPLPPDIAAKRQAQAVVAQTTEAPVGRMAQTQQDTRPRLRLAETGCEEGHGFYVPLKLQLQRGCR